MSVTAPIESHSTLPPDLIARLDQYTMPEPNSGCWLWLGPLDGHGYGKFYVGRKARQAYGVTYRLHVGGVSDGLELDHLCRNHVCVNPAHLEPVTRRVNQIRGQGFAGVNARKTHCRNGHPFDAANTYEKVGRSGAMHRDCRTCRRDATLRYEARQKAAQP